MSAVISSCLGCFFVPLLDWVKAHQVFRTEGPKDHFTKAGTATMGGLFFIPVGIGVARFATGKSVELWGVCATTLAFATIGLLDDGLTIWRKHNYGTPGWFKFLLQVCCLWI
jgi:phospho-N-acetylmuramoyl-pentapeptide-transferase